MAGSKLKRRLKASTILEVVISMTIIVIVFGIAMMIFTNVLRFSLSAKKLRAQALLRETMLNAEQNPVNASQSLAVDDFRIEEVAEPYPQNSNLTAIHLTAYDQNQQKVAELQKVIINQP
jgi:type II secretory pathway pseudopilin PulG